MPDKEEKKKSMDQFRFGEEDVGAGKTFYFKKQVQQYKCLNLDANFYC